VKDFQQAAGVKEANVMGHETRDRLTLENDPNFKNLPDAINRGNFFALPHYQQAATEWG
jgi:hypothetical protein